MYALLAKLERRNRVSAVTRDKRTVNSLVYILFILERKCMAIRFNYY